MLSNYENFSYRVEDYFTKRDSYPILLTYEKPYNSEQIENLRSELFKTFKMIKGVEVIMTDIIDFEDICGVLIELTDEEFIFESSKEFIFDNYSNMEELDNYNKCYTIAKKLYNKYSLEEQKICKNNGFKYGKDVYTEPCLESLGEEYFRIKKPIKYNITSNPTYHLI